MSSIISSFGRNVCIDMGTVNSRVLVAGKSVITEPSVVATDPWAKRRKTSSVGPLMNWVSFGHYGRVLSLIIA